jgi:hypothetical protein
MMMMMMTRVCTYQGCRMIASAVRGASALDIRLRDLVCTWPHWQMCSYFKSCHDLIKQSFSSAYSSNACSLSGVSCLISSDRTCQGWCLVEIEPFHDTRVRLNCIRHRSLITLSVQRCRLSTKEFPTSSLLAALTNTLWGFFVWGNFPLEGRGQGTRVRRGWGKVGRGRCHSVVTVTDCHRDAALCPVVSTMVTMVSDPMNRQGLSTSCTCAH